MKKFTISALITVGTYTTVEAETEEQALEIAKQRLDLMSFTGNNGDTSTDCWMIDELDGVPYNLTIED